MSLKASAASVALSIGLPCIEGVASSTSTASRNCVPKPAFVCAETVAVLMPRMDRKYILTVFVASIVSSFASESASASHQTPSELSQRLTPSFSLK